MCVLLFIFTLVFPELQTKHSYERDHIDGVDTIHGGSGMNFRCLFEVVLSC